MSRSNPESVLENPAVRFFDWAGDTGELKYYDKEKKEKVTVKLPFHFLVLDTVAQVGGGFKSGKDYIGYWSNAVRSRDIKGKQLVVKSKINGAVRVEGQGLWSEIKASLPGSKFINGIYAAFYDENKEMQIGYIKFKGAANSAWIEFNTASGLRGDCGGAYTLKERSEELQNGNTTYYEPRFSYKAEVKDETEARAIELDAVLQAYLVPYFAQNQQGEIAVAVGQQQEYSGPPEHGDAWEDEAPDYIPDDEDLM